MDTSEKYIKMCESAVEIQAMRAPDKDGQYASFEYGDFFATFGEHWMDKKPCRHIEVYGTTDNLPSRHEMPSPHDTVYLPGFEEGDGYETEKIIWLPRLDQLIAMNADTPWHFTLSIPENGNSLETTWLAIVMRNKFEKSWNGKEWL